MGITGGERIKKDKGNCHGGQKYLKYFKIDGKVISGYNRKPHAQQKNWSS